MVKEARKEVTVPMVFMTYINPIYTYGKEKFMKRCVECQMDGIIVPDMPFEEKAELADICEEYGIDLISMIAPTSEDRIAAIAREAKGFLYCVSSLGVTGVRSEIKTDVGEMVSMVRQVSDIPCAVGFGISTPAQAAKMASVSDGAIVGSAIVKIVAQYGGECVPKVAEYVKEMKKAVAQV